MALAALLANPDALDQVLSQNAAPASVGTNEPKAAEGCRHPEQHRVAGVCHFDVASTTVTLPCGHKFTTTKCGECTNPSLIICNVLSVGRAKGCGHKVRTRCHSSEQLQQPLAPPHQCGMILTCGHRCRSWCCCRNKAYAVAIGKGSTEEHALEQAEAAEHVPCTQMCHKSMPCGHKCERACHYGTPCSPLGQAADAEHEPCRKICATKMRCGHKCELACHYGTVCCRCFTERCSHAACSEAPCPEDCACQCHLVADEAGQPAAQPALPCASPPSDWQYDKDLPAIVRAVDETVLARTDCPQLLEDAFAIIINLEVALGLRSEGAAPRSGAGITAQVPLTGPAAWVGEGRGAAAAGGGLLLNRETDSLVDVLRGREGSLTLTPEQTSQLRGAVSVLCAACSCVAAPLRSALQREYANYGGTTWPDMRVIAGIGLGLGVAGAPAAPGRTPALGRRSAAVGQVRRQMDEDEVKTHDVDSAVRPGADAAAKMVALGGKAREAAASIAEYCTRLQGYEGRIEEDLIHRLQACVYRLLGRAAGQGCDMHMPCLHPCTAGRDHEDLCDCSQGCYPPFGHADPATKCTSRCTRCCDHSTSTDLRPCDRQSAMQCPDCGRRSWGVCGEVVVTCGGACVEEDDGSERAEPGHAGELFMALRCGHKSTLQKLDGLFIMGRYYRDKDGKYCAMSADRLVNRFTGELRAPRGVVNIPGCPEPGCGQPILCARRYRGIVDLARVPSQHRQLQRIISLAYSAVASSQLLSAGVAGPGNDVSTGGARDSGLAAGSSSSPAPAAADLGARAVRQPGPPARARL